jgi:hypothetical protein
MYWSKKVVIKVLVVLMLFFSIPAIANINMVMTAEAAVKAPSVKEQKITLYVAYKDYAISFNNLVKGAVITYKSSNVKVASVSAKGIVKPAAVGTATIYTAVKQNKKIYNLKLYITVKNPFIKLTQSTNYLNTGDTFIFEAKAYGTNSKITWSSSNSDTITISSKGRVTAEKSGKATIYAKAGDITAKCRLDIGTNRLGSFSRNITVYDDFTVWIKVTDLKEDENLQWVTAGNDIITCKWADSFEENRIALTIEPLKAGTDTITITSNKTNDKLFINVNVTDKPKDKEVLSAEDIYEQCGQSTVEIYAYYSGEESLGSGFYVNKGMIVTNYHVIEGAEKIEVKTYDGKTVNIKTIIGFDKELDLAILGIDKQSPPLTISQDKVAVGQDVYAIGSPFGLTGTMSKGMVTTASRNMDDKVDYIQIDASISPGNSGGPLINKYGEVIGVNTMYIVDGQNLNFAINIKELQKINTNKPMSITEYIDTYDSMFYDDLLANSIEEDAEKSQHMDTCQEIPSNTAVVGTLKSGENWDVYKFEMSDYGYYSAFIYYKDDIGIKDSYFVLMDEDEQYYFAEQGEDENIAKLYEVLLSPGTYYIVVMHQKEEYVGDDIEYLFYTARTFG